jgi:hypothetical protein
MGNFQTSFLKLLKGTVFFEKRRQISFHVISNPIVIHHEHKACADVVNDSIHVAAITDSKDSVKNQFFHFMPSKSNKKKFLVAGRFPSSKLFSNCCLPSLGPDREQKCQI